MSDSVAADSASETVESAELLGVAARVGAMGDVPLLVTGKGQKMKSVCWGLIFGLPQSCSATSGSHALGNGFAERSDLWIVAVIAISFPASLSDCCF